MLRKILITMLVMNVYASVFAGVTHISELISDCPAIYLAVSSSTPRPVTRQPSHNAAPPPIWHRRSEIETRRTEERINRTADRQLDKTREMERRQEEQRK